MAHFFVGGSQRTGTTLLQLVLCQDQTANPMIREASYVRNLVSLYCDSKRQLSANLADYFDSLQDVRDFHAALLFAFLQRTASRFGNCGNLVLKEPALTIFFPDLAELLTDARFLMIVRDPRDAIASMIRVGQKQESLGQRYIFASRDIPKLCQHYRSFYAPVFNSPNQQFRDRILVVRYEDLVRRPDEIVKSLRVFTGLALDRFDPTSELDYGRVDVQSMANQPVYQPWTTELSGRPISDAGVGRRRDVLTEEEIRQVELCCKDFFESFNYCPDSKTADSGDRRAMPPAPHSAQLGLANSERGANVT